MKIAIVEDDINMRKSLEIAMAEYDKYEIVTFKSAKDALKKLDDSFELIISDINMPTMDGIEFVKELDGRYSVIIMTGNATLSRAIESIQLGVKDFLLKPFEIESLIESIERVSKISQKTSHIKKAIKPATNTAIRATSPALDELLAKIHKAAITDVSIMLLGESGVGKEVLAKHIHDNSKRANKPFIAINMAAIPDNLIESELFGFEKGSFTDAIEAKKGQIELANGGTLFLDEIGEMPYHLQAKLLRVLQEREIKPIGSSKSIKLDIRIVSATNANIAKNIDDGLFREDLYYRLNTIALNIPPLRERHEEIMSLANDALIKFCSEYGFAQKYFGDSAIKALEGYYWPGNIRELLSVVERAVILSDSDEITKGDLSLESRGLGRL